MHSFRAPPSPSIQSARAVSLLTLWPIPFSLSSHQHQYSSIFIHAHEYSYFIQHGNHFNMCDSPVTPPSLEQNQLDFSLDARHNPRLSAHPSQLVQPVCGPPAVSAPRIVSCRLSVIPILFIYFQLTFLPQRLGIRLVSQLPARVLRFRRIHQPPRIQHPADLLVDVSPCTISSVHTPRFPYRTPTLMLPRLRKPVSVPCTLTVFQLVQQHQIALR